MFFFDDIELGAIKKRAALRCPPIPDTGWRPPGSFPNLSGAKVISIDTETKESDWEHGPGWSRGKVSVVGFSVGARDAHGNQGKWYFPIRHEVEPEMNLDPATCLSWLKHIVETPAIPKVFANSLYDIGTLTAEGIYVQGEVHDVQFSEALLNEDGEVALEYLGQKYLGTGKETDKLYQWLAEAYGGDANSGQRANIYRAPPRLVGPYAEMDADLPLRVLDHQWPRMRHENLLDLYRMECDLVYLLVQMRLTGIKVDLSAAQSLYGELAVDIQGLYKKLHDMTGVNASVNDKDDLIKIFDAAGIKYPRTKPTGRAPNGNPSFTKQWLKNLDDPVGALINTIREHQIIRGTFIRNYILEGNTNGRIHCQFHPLRGDDGGTRTGRFASSDPNLQNIPVRTDLGKRVRKLFLPDDGHVGIRKNDYSQIEYRFLAHFAVGEGADAVRARYCADPDTDYHVMTQELVKLHAHMDIERRPIKNINFGLLYGMGEDKLSRQIGTDRKTAKTIFAGYHKGNPYVKATMEAASLQAQVEGYTTTILGRRRRFNMWEPREINYDNRALPLRYDAAIKMYGSEIKRAHTHKAINSELQGSAADIIKKGMVECYKAGIFSVTGVPKLQVHDELDFSMKYREGENREYDEAHAEMRRILETCIPLKVPVVVDYGDGPNWGEID